MKAYLLHALQLNGQHFDASTDQKPSIVDLDDAEFARLSEMLAVRAPTEQEIGLHRLMGGVEDAEIVSETPAPKRGGQGKAAPAAPAAPAAETNSAPTSEEI